MPRHNRYLIAIIAVSVLARGLAALWMGNEVISLPGTDDQVSYHALALRVLGGHGFSFGEAWWPATQANSPTAHWSFLYTFFLVGVYGIFGPAPLVARMIQAVIAGILQPFLAYRLGSRIFSQSVGLVAAGLTAGYAYFVYYDAALMTEGFFFCAVLATLYLAAQIIPPAEAARPRPGGRVWWLAAGLGFSAGMAVLLRQVFLLFLPVLFACVWWLSTRRGQGRLSLARLALAGGLVVGMLLPFTAYNYARFKLLVLLNTNAGFAFYWANHPAYGTHFDPIITTETVNYLSLLPEELHGLNEAELDRELLKRGIGFVLADPVRYLRLSASRVPIFFMFWPSGESSLVSNLSRVGSFGVLWPLMLYGLAMAGLGIIKRQPGAGSTMGLLLAFALVYTVIHVFSWTLVRYRLPIDAVLVIFSAAGLLDLLSRVRPHSAGVKVAPT